MKMTPTRLIEQDLIDTAILAESDFQKTWNELKSKVVMFQETYETYRKNLLDRLEDFKSGLSPDVEATLFARQEIQLLMNALKTVNNMLLLISAKGVPITDAAFIGNESLSKAGFRYTNIYGEDAVSEKASGRYDIQVNPDRLVSFKLLYPSNPNMPFLDEFADGSIYRLRYNDDPTNKEDAYDPLTLVSISSRSEYVYVETTEYLGAGTYYTQNADDSYSPVSITSSARFSAIITSGTRLFIRKTSKMTYTLTTRTSREENIVLKAVRDNSIANTMIRQYLVYAPQEDTCDWYGNLYYRYNSERNTYTRVNTTCLEDLRNAQRTYGTMYLKYSAYELTNFKLINVEDFVYENLDWDNIDVDQVTCLECGSTVTKKLVEDTETRQPQLFCTECGNHNPYLMDIPEIFYTNRVRALYTYDPDFDWYDVYTTTRVIKNMLSLKPMWKGWFGHGANHWCSELDSLMYRSTLRESGWDTSAYKLATDTCFYIDNWKPYHKVNIDTLFGAVWNVVQKDPEELDNGSPVVALFQIGNLCAIRHEIIRVLCTQLYKIWKKGMHKQ